MCVVMVVNSGVWVWYGVVIKMASFVQTHLQKIKPSAKNVIDKYKEVFEQAQKELKTPEQLRQGLETFLAAGERTWRYCYY